MRAWAALVRSPYHPRRGQGRKRRRLEAADQWSHRLPILAKCVRVVVRLQVGDAAPDLQHHRHRLRWTRRRVVKEVRSAAAPPPKKWDPRPPTGVSGHVRPFPALVRRALSKPPHEMKPASFFRPAR